MPILPQHHQITELSPAQKPNMKPETPELGMTIFYPQLASGVMKSSLDISSGPSRIRRASGGFLHTNFLSPSLVK